MIDGYVRSHIPLSRSDFLSISFHSQSENLDFGRVGYSFGFCKNNIGMFSNNIGMFSNNIGMFFNKVPIFFK